MGDENLNNTEDTSVLFVSAQKKKQAEEAAKRAEAEELAKKAAREEEIKKQEEEVASRKQKAEKVGTALNKKVERGDKAGIKLPIIIGALAGIAILVFIVIKITGPKEETVQKEAVVIEDNLTFNAEYDLSSDGYDLKLSYPSDKFNKVHVEDGGNSKHVFFEQEENPDISVEVICEKILKYPFSESNFLWEWEATTRNNELKESVKAVTGGGIISRESQSTISSDNSVMYEYLCSADKDAHNSALAGWYVKSGDSIYKLIAKSTSNSDDVEANLKMRDLFEENNTENALKTPGSNTPTSTDVEDVSFYDKAKITLALPKGLFTQYLKYDNYGGVESGGQVYYTDNNGALLVITAVDFGSSDSLDPSNIDMQKLYATYNSFIEQTVVPTSKREIEEEKNAVLGIMDTYKKAKVNVDGVEMRESDYYDISVINDRYIVLSFRMYSPYKDAEVYDTIFENALAHMYDHNGGMSYE